jgi:hypothetical protein
MKLYPSTNTVVDTNDIQANPLNENTQICFETANGALDRHNFPAGSATEGLEAKDFQGSSFHEFTVATNGTPFTSPVFETSNTGWAPYKFDSNNHSNQEQGIASGRLQIQFEVGSIGFNQEGTLLGYEDVAGIKNNLPRTAFSIYVNGAKVGETDAVFKANHGTVSIPFYFYNPGGNLRVDLYCSAHSGTLQNGETVRITIQKYLYFFTTRIR